MKVTPDAMDYYFDLCRENEDEYLQDRGGHPDGLCEYLAGAVAQWLEDDYQAGCLHIEVSNRDFERAAMFIVTEYLKGVNK